MTTSIRHDDAPDPSTIKMLQIQMEIMTTEFDKVSRENTELKLHLNRLAMESAHGRDLSVLISERDRYFKLSERLKVEKGHLVETVLDLSNEVDVLQRQNLNDHLIASQKIHHFIEMENLSHISRMNMEVQVIDLLVDSGISRDGLLVKRITQIFHLSRNIPSGKLVDVDYIPSPPRAECDNAKILDRLDAATLKAIEARRSILNEPRNTSTAGSSLIPVKNKSGPKSIQSNRSRRSKLSSFPEKRRGKQAMERDETESVISSVSTHRSTKSTGIAAVSWFGSPREEKPDEDRKLGVTITAENLAILNKMNHGDTTLRDILITRPSRRPSRQQKSPDDKNIIVSNDANWWPALF